MTDFQEIAELFGGGRELQSVFLEAAGTDEVSSKSEALAEKIIDLFSSYHHVEIFRAIAFSVAWFISAAPEPLPGSHLKILCAMLLEAERMLVHIKAEEEKDQAAPGHA